MLTAVIWLLGARLVSAHGGGPFCAIVGALHLKMYLVVAGKNVDGAMVDLFPAVVFLAGIDPTVADNLEAAPTAGAASFHAQPLVAIGIAAILQRMQR